VRGRGTLPSSVNSEVVCTQPSTANWGDLAISAGRLELLEQSYLSSVIRVVPDFAVYPKISNSPLRIPSTNACHSSGGSLMKGPEVSLLIRIRTVLSGSCATSTQLPFEKLRELLTQLSGLICSCLGGCSDFLSIGLSIFLIYSSSLILKLLTALIQFSFCLASYSYSILRPTWPRWKATHDFDLVHATCLHAPLRRCCGRQPVCLGESILRCAQLRGSSVANWSQASAGSPASPVHPARLT
jgi:hypothetical protein